MLTDGSAQVVKPVCKKRANVKRTALSLDGAARIFFYLFLLIKPLYLLSSGSLQLGDICLLLAFACCLTSRRANFKIERIDLLMIGFVSSVIVIDGWYFCMYGDPTFPLSIRRQRLSESMLSLSSNRPHHSVFDICVWVWALVRCGSVYGNVQRPEPDGLFRPELLCFYSDRKREVRVQKPPC